MTPADIARDMAEALGKVDRGIEASGRIERGAVLHKFVKDALSRYHASQEGAAQKARHLSTDESAMFDNALRASTKLIGVCVPVAAQKAGGGDDEILPCPFCGKPPETEPTNPKIEGDAWGAVYCANKECQAFDDGLGRSVRVDDGADVCDERGSKAYIAAAIKRWNARACATLGAAMPRVYFEHVLAILEAVEAAEGKIWQSDLEQTIAQTKAALTRQERPGVVTEEDIERHSRGYDPVAWKFVDEHCNDDPPHVAVPLTRKRLLDASTVAIAALRGVE